jgi:hypothetical protein
MFGAAVVAATKGAVTVEALRRVSLSTVAVAALESEIAAIVDVMGGIFFFVSRVCRSKLCADGGGVRRRCADQSVGDAKKFCASGHRVSPALVGRRPKEFIRAREKCSPHCRRRRRRRCRRCR